MQHKNYQDMDIQELYTNSYRLVSQMTTDRKRYLYNQLPWETRMLCIRGARGVGKTTLLLQRIAEAFSAGSNQALYVSLDELWFNENRLIDLAEYHYTHGGTHLFLDEVHRYPQDSWAQEIKNIYDRYPGFHVVFTVPAELYVQSAFAYVNKDGPDAARMRHREAVKAFYVRLAVFSRLKPADELLRPFSVSCVFRY